MFSRTEQTQIRNLLDLKIPNLIERMPSDSWYKHSLMPSGTGWYFAFKCISENKTFFGEGTGGTPLEAFLICRHILNSQIREWHETRFLDDQTPPLSLFSDLRHRVSPRIMIVDDDIDTALSMQTMLMNLGCKTDVETRHQELHRKMVAGNTDIILLDWKLNDNVTGGQVVEKATRIIDVFSDLKKKFSQEKLKIVTYSSLNRDEVELPPAVGRYFNHLDHWQKSLPHSEIVQRASDLLMTDTVRKDF